MASARPILAGLCGVLSAILATGCGNPDAVPFITPVGTNQEPINSGLPTMLDGTWAIAIDWPVSGAAPGAAIRFLLRAERLVGGWTEQDVLDATELCDVQFPAAPGQEAGPHLAAPQAWSPAGIQVAGGTVYYNTREPATAVKKFAYEPPVIALGWAVAETMDDERLPRRPPLPLWQLESGDHRIDGDGNGQPGVTLVYPGGATQSIAVHAHFRLESTLTGSGLEELHPGLNTWPPMAVVLLSNEPINLPYLGPASRTHYGAQLYNVPTAVSGGQMRRVDKRTTCADLPRDAR